MTKDPEPPTATLCRKTCAPLIIRLPGAQPNQSSKQAREVEPFNMHYSGIFHGMMDAQRHATLLPSLCHWDRASRKLGRSSLKKHFTLWLEDAGACLVHRGYRPSQTQSTQAEDVPSRSEEAALIINKYINIYIYIYIYHYTAYVYGCPPIAAPMRFSRSLIY